MELRIRKHRLTWCRILDGWVVWDHRCDTCGPCADFPVVSTRAPSEPPPRSVHWNQHCIQPIYILSRKSRQHMLQKYETSNLIFFSAEKKLKRCTAQLHPVPTNYSTEIAYITQLVNSIYSTLNWIIVHFLTTLTHVVYSGTPPTIVGGVVPVYINLYCLVTRTQGCERLAHES